MLRRVIVPLVLSLAACGGGSGSAQQRSTAVAGVLPGAPAGTVVHLLAPEAAVVDDGLLGHSAAIIATLDVEADGAFGMVVAPDLPAPSDALVSAPGHALLRAPLAAFASEAAPALVAEAVVEAAVVTPDGLPERDAIALVFDVAGVPVPVPPDALATGEDGVLRATRLPAGLYTLFIGSADSQRYATTRVSVVAGQRTHVVVTLMIDPLAERSFLEAALGRRRAAALLEGAPLAEGDVP